MAIFEIVLLSLAMVTVGMGVGTFVARHTKFILPTDFFSIIFFTLVGIQFLETPIDIPIDNYYWLCVVFGWLAAYLISSRTNYTMVRIYDFATRSCECEPWVLWNENGHVYRQIQTNRALFTRMILGVK